MYKHKIAPAGEFVGFLANKYDSFPHTLVNQNQESDRDRGKDDREGDDRVRNDRKGGDHHTLASNNQERDRGKIDRDKMDRVKKDSD